MRWMGVLGVGLAMAGGVAQAEDVCAKAAPALPGFICVATAHGAALAPDPARADELARYASAGEQRFQARFARPATPYIVYETADLAQTRQANAALLKLGYDRVLAWPTKQTQKDSLGKALQQQVEQMQAQGKPQAFIDQVVQRRQAAMDASIDQREASVVPHELAHQWYVESGWPGVRGDVGGHYGGPGPDWMDELSAIVAESDANADARRGQFRDLYLAAQPQTSGALTQADLLDLSGFLDQVHPAHARDLAAGAPPPKPGVTVRVETSQGGPVSPINLFYVKDRMFADFLMARTGDPAVFGSILDAFKRGQTFDDWLRVDGAEKGLAPDRQGLERQWRDWLKEKLGESKVA
ncbi:hypothetical protein [Caulobacter hibisci]|uniref:Uncharacterized protein n=1 Tax=Caulobacter hibisci TaxID=2035993 RepID=A0ABS0T6A3_9CAUL|nr:hypothetical protein [Caulobacter hibisci]MBI1686392.1 hypothetical protein [Caulobacter hibisci]